eukprot:1353055-Amorphochlora_amoeboformis.AAC.1
MMIARDEIKRGKYSVESQPSPFPPRPGSHPRTPTNSCADRPQLYRLSPRRTQARTQHPQATYLRFGPKSEAKSHTKAPAKRDRRQAR